jgi:transcriptional regulator with XRE-family HTH domain
MNFALSSPQEACAELGARLKAHRLAQLIPQEELAHRAGVSLGAIRKLEKDGQATVLTFIRAAMALGLAGDLQDLFALQPQRSIADMARAEEAGRRQRAPRRSRP